MLSPSQWTIGELSSAVKDYGIFATVVIVGWKSRGAIQPAMDLFKKANAFFDKVDGQMARGNLHMQKMESGMDTLLNNHLAHLKSDESEQADHSRKLE
jgi:hypothetical protein